MTVSMNIDLISFCCGILCLRDRMEIIIAKNAGFCFGVENAVDIAVTNAGNAVTLGEIIHNRRVVNMLESIGVPVINSIDEYDSGNLIIRSHGVSKEVIDTLNARHIPYIDATCPFVKKIRNLVREKYLENKKIIIIGEKTHPEVVGINGWCDNTAAVIKSVDEIVFADYYSDLTENDDFELKDKVVLYRNAEYVAVSQTTFSIEKYAEITKFIENQLKTVEFFNTICYTTKERQSEAEKLASECDVMLVIGGKHSSNTRKLYDLCKAKCEKTYLIENIADLNAVVANKHFKLGITAGASTPKELIEEVVVVMSESQEKSIDMLNEEVAKKDVANDECKKSMTMEELLDTAEGKLVRYRNGQTMNVKVISANADGIYVSFGGKKEGFIPKDEVVLEGEYNSDDYKAGDSFKAIVKDAGKKDNVEFSKKAIDVKIKEQKECEEVLKGSEFAGVVEKAVKGGVICKLGSYTVFVPGSQIKIGYVKDLEKYVGKTLRLRMIPAKKVEGEAQEEQDLTIKGRRIVASQRIILEEERAAKEEKFWSEVVPGAIVKGKVKRFTAFGAFVSVNGKDCLAHISDLSWYKINDPSEILEINKTYDFMVLKTVRESDQVSLGYKQLQKKPYEQAFEELPIGTTIHGVVERVFPYGAFVSIKKGVDGLVPVSEISHEWVKNATEKFNPGDEVDAVIINFDGNKITLSIKALLPAPEEQPEESVEISDEDIQEHNEKKARANAKKFENKPQQRRTKTKRVEENDEPKSWSTDSSTATIGDLFKGISFDFDDDKE